MCTFWATRYVGTFIFISINEVPAGTLGWTTWTYCTYPGLVSSGNYFQVWTTRIALSGSEDDEFNAKPSKSRRSGTRYSDFSSNVSSPLVSILGEEKYRRVSQLTIHARQVSPSERCFFVLLILVTFIYAVGILTALILLCFHMWFFWTHIVNII